jgi:hypothetical protein
VAETTNSPVIAAQLPRGRDAQFREVYSNMSLTQLGPFDITLTFQKASEAVPGQLAAIDQVAVVLAPQHFKALVRSLNETLQAYETIYGALTIPDADTSPQRNAAEIVEMVKTLKEKAQPIPSSTAPRPPAKRSRGAPRKKEPQP